MALNPPQSYRKTAFIHRVGLAANKPLAADVLVGTLYYSTDTVTLERSNGTLWEAFSGTGAVPGPPGPAGPVNIVTREILSGAIDGINTIFTLANLPVVDSEQVFLNGLLQDARGIDYTISGPTITFFLAPIPGDRLLVTYQKVV